MQNGDPDPKISCGTSCVSPKAMIQCQAFMGCGVPIFAGLMDIAAVYKILPEPAHNTNRNGMINRG